MAGEVQQAFSTFLTTMQADGLRAGLAFLVKRTDYRFIGIWRFHDGKAAAAVHYDRADPARLTADEVADTATYCCFVRHSGRLFTTGDSMADRRLVEHPAREAVQAYCGVPVMDSAGNVLATLCHYDLVPRDPEQVDMELMMNVASFLAQDGHLPAYPGAAPA